MGNCIYCGKPAGFFRKYHKECQEHHEQGKARIVALVAEAGVRRGDLKKLVSQIKHVTTSSYINAQGVKKLIILGWEQAVMKALDDSLLTEEEERALIELKDYFHLAQKDLDRNGAYTKVIKGAVLRDILNGTIPERIEVQGTLPFNFQKSEKLVWVFQNVDYYEEKTRTHYVGGSQGVSIRIAKGIYYRIGGFKGERVQTSETVYMDTGLFAVTTKHIYFAGRVKRFRINYNKIVAFEPYSDGIGVQRDALRAKPQTFVTGDGWFTYNLITNLAQM